MKKNHTTKFHTTKLVKINNKLDLNSSFATNRNDKSNYFLY